MRIISIILVLQVIIFGLYAVKVGEKHTGWLDQDNCNNFDNENACRGNQTQNDDSWTTRGFQTPPRGDSLWREKWQDYNILVGYPQVFYSSDKKSASIKIYTRLNPKYSGA